MSIDCNLAPVCIINNMNKDIQAYNASQKDGDKEICTMLFEDCEFETRLELLDTKKLSTNEIQLHYKVLK